MGSSPPPLSSIPSSSTSSTSSPLPWPSPPTVHTPPPSSPSEEEVRRLLRRYPLPALRSGADDDGGKATTTMRYDYGTAGFRYEASVLPPAMVRIGLFAALRSASLGGEEVGIMITASHNPVQDNGVKLADPDGGMLASDWEDAAVSLVNAPTDADALDRIGALCRSFSWTDGPFFVGPAAKGSMRRRRRRMVVHIGRDTRPSSYALSSLAVRSARYIGAYVIDHGVVTTPQLHYAVMHSNPHRIPIAIPRRPDECGYMETLVGNYAELIRTKATTSSDAITSSPRTLLVDCACGVGALKVDTIRSYLSRLRDFDAPDDSFYDGDDNKAGVRAGADGYVRLEVANRPGDGPLNDGCGAEHVQKKRLRPALYGEEWAGMYGRVPYGASLDGDADRVVFYRDDVSNLDGAVGGGGGGSAGATATAALGTFRLLDGDKISALVAAFLREELMHLQSSTTGAKTSIGSDVRCGVVQTAYANGASTSYLRDSCGVNVAIAKTGVKFVHAEAHHRFDAGVYFEANGHGTVLFGPKYYSMLNDAEVALRGPNTDRTDRAIVAWRRLRALPGLVNQAVGDALSDLLLVDAILYLKGWSIEMWDGIYEDMPSRQCKIKVKDRSVITTNDNETRALSPPSLQKALDAAMASASRISSSSSPSPSPPARCFVRPSGTEDAVRVYAEANSQDDADALADEAAAIVYKLCGGVGDLPVTAAKKSRL